MRFVRGEKGPPSATLFAFGGLSALALVVARVVRPHAWAFIACPLRSATGLPCLTCGMTRAFGRLAAGDVGGALAVNPLGCVLAVVAAATAGWLVLRLTIVRHGFRTECTPGEERAWRYGIAAVVALNWTWVALAGAA